MTRVSDFKDTSRNQSPKSLFSFSKRRHTKVSFGLFRTFQFIQSRRHPPSTSLFLLKPTMSNNRQETFPVPRPNIPVKPGLKQPPISGKVTLNCDAQKSVSRPLSDERALQSAEATAAPFDERRYRRDFSGCQRTFSRSIMFLINI